MPVKLMLRWERVDRVCTEAIDGDTGSVSVQQQGHNATVIEYKLNDGRNQEATNRLFGTTVAWKCVDTCTFYIGFCYITTLASMCFFNSQHKSCVLL